MADHVLCELDGGVLTVTIRRAHKKNALTMAMYSVMADAIERADRDPDVRVVLFAGSDGIFTAGNDLTDFLENPPQDADAPVNRFIAKLITTEAPLLAAVDGFAVGIGTTMLLHFEQVIASDRATFSLPFINLALVPEAGSSLLLAEACGYKKAAELLMLGQPFGVDVALECGIVSKVTAPETLMEEGLAAAHALAAMPRTALRATKRLMRRPKEPLLDRVMAEGREFAERLASPATREIIMAFMEKRAPDPSKLD
jgi:enoyl-CoA hydratase/carnithine racemase